jgi:DNA-binding MarR family transcriptional regulator
MRSRALGDILCIARCFKIYRARSLADTELSPAQQMLLSHVCRRPGLAQEELISALFLDKTTVAHRLMKLEEQGYIRREAPAEDGRCRRVYPTEKAAEIYPRIRASFESFTESMLSGFGEEERAELERLTERLCANALALLSPEGGNGP